MTGARCVRSGRKRRLEFQLNHEVIFAGTDEVIEFTHTAYSRSVFAKGAVEAGKFLAGKAAGMYDMGDVVGL